MRLHLLCIPEEGRERESYWNEKRKTTNRDRSVRETTTKKRAEYSGIYELQAKKNNSFPINAFELSCKWKSYLVRQQHNLR